MTSEISGTICIGEICGLPRDILRKYPYTVESGKPKVSVDIVTIWFLSTFKDNLLISSNSGKGIYISSLGNDEGVFGSLRMDANGGWIINIGGRGGRSVDVSSGEEVVVCDDIFSGVDDDWFFSGFDVVFSNFRLLLVSLVVFLLLVTLLSSLLLLNLARRWYCFGL